MKKILGLLAVLGLTVAGLFTAASAQAATQNGNFEWSCKIGTKEYSASVDVNRSTTPGSPVVWGPVRYASYPTNVQANRVEWTQPDVTPNALFAMGGTYQTQNDVPNGTADAKNGQYLQTVANKYVYMRVYDDSGSTNCLATGKAYWF